MVVNYKQLCAAIANEDERTFNSLIQSSPDLVLHWKPLCDAAFFGKPKLVEALLSAGADPNKRAGTASRHTPLTRITQHHKTIPRHHGHLQCLQILLDSGADPSLVGGPWSWLPIVYATVGPNLEFVERLRHFTSMDLFIAAALNENVQMRELLRHESASALDACKYSALHYLGISGMWRSVGSDQTIDCARVLLDAGAFVDEKYDIPDGYQVFGATPLWFTVAHSENNSLAEFLLKNGADPNVPVFAATFRGDLRVLELLHHYGANWNQEYAGNTPIMELFRYRRTKVVPWLLAHGARATDTDTKQRTLFHLAAIYGAKMEILQTLVDHGVDASAPDIDGVVPLTYAKQHSRKDVIHFLERLN